MRVLRNTITSNIVRLMANLSELLYVMGKHLGVYAKDSLDDLLLITHPSSSYKGMTRRVERSAVKEYIRELSKSKYVNEGVNEVIEDDTKWNERSEPNGDNFPYIRGHSNPY